jgi:hypothetical protein
LARGTSTFIDPPGSPLDIVTRWLPAFFRLYDSARDNARAAAAAKYAEECEHWKKDCFYKFGDFALRDRFPPDSRTVAYSVGGPVTMRTELEGVVEWRLLVWCGPHGEVRDPKVDELAQASWERMDEMIRIYEPKAR